MGGFSGLEPKWFDRVSSRSLRLVGGRGARSHSDWRGWGGGNVGLATYANYNLAFALLQRKGLTGYNRVRNKKHGEMMNVKEKRPEISKITYCIGMGR